MIAYVKEMDEYVRESCQESYLNTSTLIINLDCSPDGIIILLLWALTRSETPECKLG